MSDISDSDDDFFDARAELASPRLNLEEKTFEKDDQLHKDSTEIASNTSLELHDLLGLDGNGLDGSNKTSHHHHHEEKETIQVDKNEDEERLKNKDDNDDGMRNINDKGSDTTTARDIEQSSLPATKQQQMKVSYPPDIVTSSMKERPKDPPVCKLST